MLKDAKTKRGQAAALLAVSDCIAPSLLIIRHL